MEAALAAVGGGLGVIVLGLMAMWRGKNGTGAVDFVQATQKHSYKLDSLGGAMERQHETLKEILQVQRETKEAIIRNGRS